MSTDARWVPYQGIGEVVAIVFVDLTLRVHSVMIINVNPSIHHKIGERTYGGR